MLGLYFIQENKYKEAIGFYEPIVKKHYDNVRKLEFTCMLFIFEKLSFSCDIIVLLAFLRYLV